MSTGIIVDEERLDPVELSLDLITDLVNKVNEVTLVGRLGKLKDELIGEALA